MDRHEAMEKAAAALNNRMGPRTVHRLREQAGRVRVIPTGIMGIDLALGTGGVPRGRIT